HDCPTAGFLKDFVLLVKRATRDRERASTNRAGCVELDSDVLDARQHDTPSTEEKWSLSVFAFCRHAQSLATLVEASFATFRFPSALVIDTRPRRSHRESTALGCECDRVRLRRGVRSTRHCRRGGEEERGHAKGRLCVELPRGEAHVSMH